MAFNYVKRDESKLPKNLGVKGKNKEENRKQVLRAYRNDEGRTVYEPYDPT